MADLSSPLLVITNAGLAAATNAQQHGIFVVINSFKIGSGYGYTPQPTDVDINGSLLYQAAPSAWQNVSGNTLNVVCTIPPDAGPWQFGEVALFMSDGTMFAKAVFNTPQTKFSSLGTNVASAYVLNCLLRLAQSTAVFQIVTPTGAPQVIDIYQWSDVAPPALMANPLTPLLAIHELSAYGEASLLEQNNASSWANVGTPYRRYLGSRAGNLNATTFPVVNASTSWVEIAASRLNTQDLTVGNRGFLLQTADGYFRSVNNVQTSGSNYRFNLNVTNDGTYNNVPLPNTPQVGSNVILYRCDVEGLNLFYDQILNPPQLVPPGTILPFAGTTIPAGYLACNAAAISRTGFASLYSVIGTTYGVGNGSTTFNLPDLRGVFVRGWDNGRGQDPGRVFGTYQGDAFRSHNHAVSDPGHAHGVYDPGHSHTWTLGTLRQSGGDTSCYVPSARYGGGEFQFTETTAAVGTGIGIYGNVTGIGTLVNGGAETTPKNVAMNYIIKY
ncbi:phage tail collar domain protein [Ralstonia phage phiRSL1]|uniref:Phage tail collar domain protein n=1 Tax=Ralstonia phage phiRSL1 TaxID=1980924 RepID=B2ZY49_9CAUD|nr:tail fiber protein [Ralstonia phage phiRSL1]BAG41644.1 phage tail collar domain protein [Ralstonia phage phiRSL1]